MRFGLVKIGAIFLILILSNSPNSSNSSNSLGAQTPSPSSPTNATGSLEAAIAVEDPATRIIALQKFIRTNNVPERSLTAREAIVASWAQLAEVQLGENNIEKAVADFRKAIAALPENVTDRFFVETVFRIPQAVSVRGYRNEAIGLARQIEKRVAKEPQHLAGIGEFYMTIEAPSDAIRALESSVKLDGEDSRLHRLLGSAYRMGLRLDDAIVEYQQAIKIDPNEKRAYYELANLYRAHGAYSDAIRLYNKQLEIDPQHTASYKGIALTYLAQGNDAQAEAALNQARDLRGAAEEIQQDIYLQTQMAFYYLNQSKLKQARQAATNALSIEPRYAWGRIAAAEVDLAEGKYFEAERNLLAAQQYAGFPTLLFTFGKLYIAVEDFDGALEQFAKAFNYSQQKQFTTKLGGVLDVQAENLKDLLAREHQAAIFLAESPSSEEQFKLAESLVHFSIRLRAIKSAPQGRAAKADPDFRRKQLEDIEQAAMDFVDAEKTRRSFRALNIAQRLAQAGVLTGTAVELADQALGVAEVAIEFDGSVRDYPNYDREGRLRIFRGRALDAKGWALFKAGKNQEAVTALSESVQAYGPLPEGKRAVWHLATVKETGGDLREALDLYIAGYEPPSTKSNLDVNRTVIEGLYRKVNGSLDGLDEKLKRASSASGTELLASLQPAEKNSSNNLKSKPDTGTFKSSGIVEPQTIRQSEKKESQFKFSIPPAPSAKDTMGSTARPKQKTNALAGKPLAVPTTDPMFAKKSSADQGTEPRSADSEVETSSSTASVAEPTPVPISVVRAPVELPDPSSNLVRILPVTQLKNHRKLIERFNSPTIYLEDDLPPAPPAAENGPKVHTRLRQVHTRKRRVTMPDDQSNR